MKKITINLSEEYVNNDDHKNYAIRYMERLLVAAAGAKVLSSSRYYLTVAVEDDVEDKVYELVNSVLTQRGGITNLSETVNYQCENYESTSQAEEPAERRARESERPAEGAEAARDKGDTSWVERAEREERAKEEAVPPYDLEALLDEVPMKHSEDLKNYLRETDRVIPMLRAMDNEKRIWSQNLLVSIDSGFGLTTFLKTLVKVHINNGLIPDREDVSYYFVEDVMTKEKEKPLENSFKEVIGTAHRMSVEAERKKITIYCIDISEFQQEITKSLYAGYLQALADESKNYICVFRVPFMDRDVVDDIAASLEDVMNIKTLCVPPVPVDDMVVYMKNRLKKFGIESDDSCDEYLERQLLNEKKDDSFFGYKTLNKVIDKVIYDKAVKNSLTGQADLKLTGADINVPDYVEEENFNPAEAIKEMIGMELIGEQVNEIVAQMKAVKDGLVPEGVERPSIHMLFTGNPGTGKTTVARIVARIMKEQGILRKGHLHEYKGRDLCGRYIGETAPKTSAICRDAYGSVLFIDEAYSLFRGEDTSARDYGREALDTLVAEMENHRDDMCVILAGYKDDMDTMLKGNAGLRGRIPYEIEFPNYSREELAKIFFKMVGDKFGYDDEFKASVEDFFNNLPDEFLESKEFSNARFVRNLYEKVWGKAVYRKAIGNDTEARLIKTDLENAIKNEDYSKLSEKKNKKIGFV